MGCGTSTNQFEDVAPPKIRTPPIEPISPNKIPSTKPAEVL
jgi:hypothetical protein